MCHISELPIPVEVRPLELIGAFLGRAADENVLSPKQLTDVIRASAYGTRSDPTGVTEGEALSRMLSTLGDPDLAEQPSAPSDLVLRNWSERSFKQICPACLEADQTVTHGLTERSWAVCLVHRFAHLTHCPQCRARLSWAHGTYFHCACGYDLRFGPFVHASPELGEFLAAVARDHAPACRDAAAAAKPLDDLWAVKSRLKTTFAYFAGGLNTSSGGIPLESDSPTTPFLKFWDEILQVVVAAGGLEEAVRAIETRLALAGRARSNSSVKEGHLRRSQITWRYLAGCAGTAMAAAPRMDKHRLHLDTHAGHRLSADMEAVKKLPCELSSALRSALDSEIGTYLRAQDGCPEAVQKRINAVTDLAKDLRRLRAPDWMKPAFSDVAEILSLIACGVLTPFGPSYVPSWHVRATHVAEIVKKFAMLPCNREALGPGAGYVMQHSMIFDARASVLEWLSLSRKDVVERVQRLLPEWIDSMRHAGPRATTVTGSRLPFGLGYFLAHPWVGRFAVEGASAIGECYLVSSDEEALQEALVDAWETATSQLAGLQGWGRDSALAAQQVLDTCSPAGNPILCVRAAAASLAFRTKVGQQKFALTLSEFLGERPGPPADCRTLHPKTITSLVKVEALTTGLAVELQ